VQYISHTNYSPPFIKTPPSSDYIGIHLPLKNGRLLFLLLISIIKPSLRQGRVPTGRVGFDVLNEALPSSREGGPRNCGVGGF